MAQHAQPGTRTRRRLLVAGGAWLLAGVARSAPGGAGTSGLEPDMPEGDAMHPDYAESVAVSGLATDAGSGFGARLGRFPPRGSGSLSMSAHVGGRHYAVSDAPLTLVASGATPIDAREATFAVAGASQATFASSDRHTPAMHGRVLAQSRAHGATHPEPGIGDIPILIEATFRVGHPPVQVRPGRMEVMGRVLATVTVGDERHVFDVPGKWHEQVGPRRRFAPAFTYLFVQGDGIGIMASRQVAQTSGYVLEQGTTTAISRLDIDPYGSPERRFTATLADGRRITGVARVLRETSAPIEGQRRPGATVRVESDIGSMVGALNDWDPRD
jgi:hypothetical protein